MKNWIICPRCNGKMFAQGCKEGNKIIYSGFECVDCHKRIVTNDMSFEEMLTACVGDGDDRN